MAIPRYRINIIYGGTMRDLELSSYSKYCTVNGSSRPIETRPRRLKHVIGSVPAWLTDRGCFRRTLTLLALLAPDTDDSRNYTISPPRDLAARHALLHKDGSAPSGARMSLCNFYQSQTYITTGEPSSLLSFLHLPLLFTSLSSHSFEDR